MKKVIIIGGGATGFFAAINAKEMNPNLDIIILEKGKEVLQKIKISGGGRCNLTHACFEPKELINFYPRGFKELLGPFNKFMTKDTFEWFENHGVALKIEKDNRVFPKANTSQSIIDCFQNFVLKLGIKILTNQGVNKISKYGNKWLINTKEQEFESDFLIIATGSSKQAWNLCKTLKHTIIEPVPSLFTFNLKDKRIKELLGISVPNSCVKLPGTSFESSGPLLITHWGLSGPAILKLSSFSARYLAEHNYKYDVEINWLGKSFEDTLKILNKFKIEHAKKNIISKSPFDEISCRLWQRLTEAAEINDNQNWANLTKLQIEKLLNELLSGLYHANGRTTFKDEFVTAGGIDLNEINFKTFESKLHKNLFFGGEVLNIDAVTGGFNFQNAWTDAYIIAKSIATKN